MKPDFEALFAQYSSLLSRVASGYEADPALRDELAQDIALAVWQSLQAFEGRSNIKTYILKVAHNRAVSHVSRQVRQPQNNHYQEADSVPSSSLNSNPAVATEQAQSQQRLLEAIRRLSIQSRQVVTLSLEGLSYDEISDVCGLGVSHVGVLLNRAKSTLKKELSQ